MKTIHIKNGFFSLLIFEAAIIGLVTFALMLNLFNIYTNLVYNESAEVLNLYTTIADSKLMDIEDTSFEILSNRDIQKNLLLYTTQDSSYDQYNAVYNAVTGLYTQLFTRWVMDDSLISMSFIFRDGKRVDTGYRKLLSFTDEEYGKLVKLAKEADGSCGWIANIAGENTVTLYRLIKDISGNGFKPLGVLLINVDAKHILNYTPVVPQNYKPEMICIAGDEILSLNPTTISRTELYSFLNSTNTYDIVKGANGALSFVSVKKSSHSGWHFVYMLSVIDILSSIYNINKIYIAVLLFIVIIAIITGYVFTNAISRPLAQLTDTMKVVEGGDYSAVSDINPHVGLFSITEVLQLSNNFTRMIKEIDHLINEGYVKQLTILEMRYKMLQQQINPHFLYNTLDTINWKAISNGDKDISIMVRSLSGMLRGSIKGSDIITVREDMAFVQDYIAIQSIRFEERLKFTVDMVEQSYSCRIPRLTLQPIVENCIIHNLEKYSGVCEIRIISTISEGLLVISIQDNGHGVDPLHIEMVLSGLTEAANSSIGLKNINERIRITFGERYGIHVENMQPSGTRVAVLLPFEEELHEDIADCG
jgi:two-component system sensor histidine kinase YesM